jgi:hypothetical protein
MTEILNLQASEPEDIEEDAPLSTISDNNCAVF